MSKLEGLKRSELEQRLIELRQSEWEIEAERQDVRQELKRRKSDQPISGCRTPTDAYFLDLPIKLSGASTRLTNALTNLGCRTLRDAEGLKEWEISEFPNVGASTIRELRSLLQGNPPIYSETQLQAMRALELYQSGKDLAEVGELLDVSVPRAGQLTHEGRRLSQRFELLHQLEQKHARQG